MRPVNLIPPEDRRGDRAPLRAGSMSYVIVGACAVALVAVLALVLTQNSITERENEIAQLEVARDAAAERASALAPYAQFASLQQEREQTISSLAESRFDWERVLRELALVIPANVSLDSLEAATASDAEGDAASGATGVPSMIMSGCAPTHDDVAAFVAALKDIDGITRVGLENSTKGDEGGSSGGSGGGADSGATCAGGSASFSLTAVFDGVAAADPALGSPSAAPAEAAPPPAEAASEEAETNSQDEQLDDAKNASNLVPGTAR